MRSIPTFVEMTTGSRTSASFNAPRRGRYLAGAIATASAFALLQCNAPEANASTPARPSAVIYTVKQGDTVSQIASRNHVSMSSIAALNSLVDVNRIFAGGQLFIPNGNQGGVQIANTSTTPAKKTTAVVTVKVTTFPNTAAYNAAPSLGGPLPLKLSNSPARLALRPSFVKAAADYHVPLELLEAMDWNESGWQNNVVSNTGAVGVGQLMPDTVTFVNQQLIHASLDPTHADQNIRLSAAFLHYLLGQTHNDPKMALAAYYQGLSSIQTNGIYPETDQYVRTVLAVQRAYF